jgi:hypothetical protein
MKYVHFISGLRGSGKSMLSIVLSDYLQSQGRIVSNVDSLLLHLDPSNSPEPCDQLISFTNELYTIDPLLLLILSTDDTIVELHDLHDFYLLDWLKQSIGNNLSDVVVSHWFISSLSAASWSYYQLLLNGWNEIDLEVRYFMILNEFHKVEYGGLPPNLRDICNSHPISLLYVPPCKYSFPSKFNFPEIIQNTSLTHRIHIIQWYQSVLKNLIDSKALPQTTKSIENSNISNMLPKSLTSNHSLSNNPSNFNTDIDDSPWI